MSNSTPKFIGSNQLLKRNFGNSGFTLMEIIVATTVFVIVVTSVLVLFNFVLRINRQVQATRQASQGSRNFTEILSREIRNGKIDYTSSECNSATYADAQNYTLGIVSYSGDKLCFTLDKASGILYLRREIGTEVITESVNPENFTINPDTFNFIVRPSTDPFGGSNQGIQPMVTIVAEFEVYKGGPYETIIPYQTTISTDVYDIPHAP